LHTHGENIKRERNLKRKRKQRKDLEDKVKIKNLPIYLTQEKQPQIQHKLNNL